MPRKPIYVDTSAVYALLNRADAYHDAAQAVWPELLEDDTALVTSNYTVAETTTVLQYRIGFEAARLWCRDVLQVIEVYWVDASVYRRALEVWLNLGQRGFSLVDCIGFVVMNQHSIDTVFGFKDRYRKQGFVLIPHAGASPATKLGRSG